MKAIYKIVNNCNGLIYIGQSSNPTRRFKSHISRAKNNSNMKIHKAMREFGIENFSFEIIEWTDNPDEKEKMYIKEYNSLYPNGYNELEGGIDILPHSYGENHHNSVISDKNVKLIKDMLKNTNYTQIEICNLINPHPNQVMINAINMGRTHRDDNETYPLRAGSPYHLSSGDVNDIKWLLLNSDLTVYQIANYYCVNPSTIKHINSGRNYHDDNMQYPLHKRTYGKRNLQPVETILAKRSMLTIDT